MRTLHILYSTIRKSRHLSTLKLLDNLSDWLNQLIIAHDLILMGFLRINLKGIKTVGCDVIGVNVFLRKKADNFIPTVLLVSKPTSNVTLVITRLGQYLG